ncbi:hypothetical protein [Agarivorans sp. QJM3NY_25]|uniref:hypothetical protein n=1 Tax=Agarivorans sp. QJM3NY_25 TaxID=3421430 RepID=UPI003D7D6993
MKKVKLSLFDILARLGGSAPIIVEPPPSDPNEKRVTQSVRFPPDVRHWITTQADHLGVSVQDFISLTMKGVMVTTNSPQTDDFDTMVMRFFQLFKAHGVATADIPHFLPEGSISRSGLRDNNKIIDLLDDPVVEHICSIFGVQESWLKGKSDYPYRSRRFYKNLTAILVEITRHKLKTGRKVDVLFLTESGVKLDELAQMAKESDGRDSDSYVHVILKLEKRVNGQDIITYQLWDSLPWDYWRSRQHAKALIYFCDKTQNFTSAYSIEKDKLSDFVSGQKLLTNISSHGQHWLLDELVWDDDRNPERWELAEIKKYFSEQGGDPYMFAVRYTHKIKNRDEFISGKEPLVLDESR